MQPDFSALFRKAEVAPLSFSVRPGANAVHDVHFLSSYLHDARSSTPTLTRQGETLTILLNRDCWEFGYTATALGSELHIANSRLTISPVLEIRWKSKTEIPADRELWIESIYLGPAHWEADEASELVITAPHGGWRIAISLAEDFGEIRLEDQEVPYLYSRRKA